MTVPVLTAVTGEVWEAALVTTLERRVVGVTVVRRCVDIADLLATAAAGTARAALLSAGLRRLDRDALGRLAASGVAVVGLVTPGDEESERRLRQLGVAQIVPADAAPDHLAAAVVAAVDGRAGIRRPLADRDGRDGDGRDGDGRDGDGRDRVPWNHPPATGAGDLAYGDPRAALPDLADPVLDPVLGRSPGRSPGPAAPVRPGSAADPVVGPIGDSSDTTARGRLVAVWGPTGAPGRTTVAVNVAAELAFLGTATLLADADVYGGVVAQVLGLLDDAPGLAAAARMANSGTLDLPALAALAPVVSANLRVLTGIARPDRWPELRPSALEPVYALARALAGVTVVDCGFALERDEEITYDTATPRRNGATLTTLELADTVVVVGSADPIGMQRLVRGLADLREVVPAAPRMVVVTKVRKGPVGADPERQVTEALERYAGVRDVVLVPYDRSSLDESLLHGRVLAEVAPGSPIRAALADLAYRLVEAGGQGPGIPRGRGRRRWPRRVRAYPAKSSSSPPTV